MKIFGIVRSAVQLITDRFVDDDLRQPNLTLRGNIAVESLIVGPFGPVPTVAVVDNDAVVPAQTVALGITENYVYNTVAGAWNRALSIPNNADGQAALTQGTPGVIARLQLFNGTSFDRQRGNVEGIALASAVRAATTTSADIVNYNGSSATLVLSVTAVPGVDTVQMIIEGKDIASGAYYTLISSTASPLLRTAAVAVTDIATYILPRVFRVRVVHTGVGNFTYSVGYSISST